MIEEWIRYLLAQAPWAASVLMIMGIARLINKPLFTFLRAVVEATPTPTDNVLLDKVMNSKVYSVISFVLDWVASVKLPQPTPPASLGGK